MTKKELVKKLLLILQKHLKIDITISEDYQTNRDLFRAICNRTLKLDGISNDFYNLQDELLSIEKEEKGIVDINTLKFIDKIALWQGDITRLNAEAIVNAANDEYLGCFLPCHNCIDNIIMTYAGFQMRNELLELKTQKNYDLQKVKITKAYNLPSKFVFHIAGPQIFGQVTKSEEIALSLCYVNCLDMAKQKGLKSIAFCCISTGVYNFPNTHACLIAVDTVKKWLKENDYDIKVIFNVYLDIDKECYERKLF